MPKVEKAIHLDAFKLYMEMGGMSPEFLSQFVADFGKNVRTAQRWEKDLDWVKRAKEPIQEAVAALEETEKLDAQELIAGFLDMCKTGFSNIETKASYIDAIFGTAYDRIPNASNPTPENPIVVESIEDMDRLANMDVKLIKAKIELAKLALLLVGEPDSRSETTIRLIDVLREGRAKNDNSS